MPRFFCEEIENGTAVLRGENAYHLSRVLRMKPGERLTLCDLHGTDYEGEISVIDSDSIVVRILSQWKNETEAVAKITLFQALPKGDKLDFIVQKATEMGAVEIVPVLTKFCVARADSQSFSKKRIRLQKIALEAAKQSGRGIIPAVSDIITFDHAVAKMSELQANGGCAIAFYEGGGLRISELLNDGASKIALFIGSEGGFAEEEIAACNAVGIPCATLGKRILRCETAPIAAISLILAALGEV